MPNSAASAAALPIDVCNIDFVDRHYPLLKKRFLRFAAMPKKSPFSKDHGRNIILYPENGWAERN
jgi:hypothetical protein